MRSNGRFGGLVRLAVFVASCACIPVAPADATVLVPDNGTGTAAMPIHAPYIGLELMQITNGLPLGSSIDISAVLEAPIVSAEQPGGSLGGTQSAGGGTLFTWQMVGTGALAGFSRTLSFPAMAGPGGVASFSDSAFNVIGSSYEMHAAPRTPGAPVQSFDTEMFRLYGQINVDPDFALLRVVAGNDFGLGSPGHTTLTDAGGGNWSVDSFFDLSYRIDFIGAVNGPLGGLSGSTTGAARFEVGNAPVPEPATGTLLGIAALALIGASSRRSARRR